MAGGCDERSSLDYEDDLSCDGSDFELTKRFRGIQCDSGKNLEIVSSDVSCEYDIQCDYRQVKSDDVGHGHKDGDSDSANSNTESEMDISPDIISGLNNTNCESDRAEPITITYILTNTDSLHQQDPSSVVKLTTPISNKSSVNILSEKEGVLQQVKATATRYRYTQEFWEIILRPDNDGDNLMFIAIVLNQFELCSQLLTLIPCQSLLRWRRNKLYQTALHLAALTDSARLARRLLVAGVQVDARDSWGNTALHIACRRGTIAVAEALLNPVRYVESRQNVYDLAFLGIPQDLDIRNYEGQTCFMIAAGNGDTTMMDLLISKQVNVNVRDVKSGMTCLHVAVETGNEKVVKYLVDKARINIELKTYSGFTALDIANIRGRSLIAYTLLCAGARPELKPINSRDFLAESDSDYDSD